MWPLVDSRKSANEAVRGTVCAVRALGGVSWLQLGLWWAWDGFCGCGNGCVLFDVILNG